MGGGLRARQRKTVRSECDWFSRQARDFGIGGEAFERSRRRRCFGSDRARCHVAARSRRSAAAIRRKVLKRLPREPGCDCDFKIAGRQVARCEFEFREAVWLRTRRSGWTDGG